MAVNNTNQCSSVRNTMTTGGWSLVRVTGTFLRTRQLITYLQSTARHPIAYFLSLISKGLVYMVKIVVTKLT
jgi:hypothetical protein